MEITFAKAVPEAAESAWHVLADGVVIGRVERREQSGLNRVKDFRYSGSDYSGRTRRRRVWEASVEGIGRDDYERLAVRRHITKPKVDRESAAQHLVGAYKAAGIDFPQGAADESAA
jgi:hypothetical protein